MARADGSRVGLGIRDHETRKGYALLKMHAYFALILQFYYTHVVFAVCNHYVRMNI